MIVQNAVTCNKCDDFIVSKHRHDFVTCKCGAVSVDGGQSYLRRVGDVSGGAIEHSWEIPDIVYMECAAAVQEAIDTNRNKYGIANAVMRALRRHNRVVAEHEQWIMAHNPGMNEVMVVEVDGTVNLYKKVTDVVE